MILKTFSDCPVLLDIISKYKVNFEVFYTDGCCDLNLFVIPEEYRGKHLGSKIMEFFTQWLDENEYDCKLLASKELGTDIHILLNFYSKFGFEDIDCDYSSGQANLYRKHI